MENGKVIETFDLTKNYPNQTAVHDLSFSVKEGEIFGFLGPNGAGKTTTLLMLMGLSRPSGGSAKVCGLDPVRKAREVKGLVGYLPENVGFYQDMDAVQSLGPTAEKKIIGVSEDARASIPPELIKKATESIKAAVEMGDVMQIKSVAEELKSESDAMAPFCEALINWQRILTSMVFKKLCSS